MVGRITTNVAKTKQDTEWILQNGNGNTVSLRIKFLIDTIVKHEPSQIPWGWKGWNILRI